MVINFTQGVHQRELDDIIIACTNNDLRAQEKLYKHYFPLMYTICNNFSNERQTIISLVNEGFLKIFLNLKSFDTSKGHFESWAKRIVTNTAIDYVRSLNKKVPIVYGGEKYLEESAAPQYPTDYMEEEVMCQVNKLPKVTQSVFRMHIINGYSHKEVSQMLEITESTCRWHVAEARKRLKLMSGKIL